MNAGLLPFVLMAVAIALALTNVPWPFAVAGIVGFATCALVVALLPIPQSASTVIFVGFWASAIAAAALVLVPQTLPSSIVIAAAVNGGAWFGGMAALSDARLALLLVLPITFFFVPGRWFRYRKREVVLKVLASWTIAVSSLAAFVSLVPTPGYERDHME